MLKIFVRDRDDEETLGDDVDFLISRFQMASAPSQKEARPRGVIAQARTR